MQKPHAAGNEKKNKVKKLQETYRYNEPIFLFIYTCTYSLKKPAHNCDEKIQIQFLVSILLIMIICSQYTIKPVLSYLPREQPNMVT